ncbi:MAG: hypothetical protein ACK2T3_05140, partial [Candidatus Promineifilaceae bacterium]
MLSMMTIVELEKIESAETPSDSDSTVASASTVFVGEGDGAGVDGGDVGVRGSVVEVGVAEFSGTDESVDPPTSFGIGIKPTAIS